MHPMLFAVFFAATAAPAASSSPAPAATPAATSTPSPAVEVTPSPSPSPATSPSPKANSTPLPAGTPAATPTPGVTLPVSPELPPVPTPTPRPAASPAPGGTPAPAATAPSRAGTGFLDQHRTRWPLQITLSWDQGLARRTIHAALDKPAAKSEEALLVAAEGSPIRGLAIAADFQVNSTRTLLVPANGTGCSDYVRQSNGGASCYVFAKDVWYVTQSNYAMLWAKPYLTFGAFRVFAAAGAGIGTIDYLYSRDPAFSDQTWGKGSARVLGFSGAVGGDWALKLSDNGACFVVSASLAAGAPAYGENVPNLFFPNHTWSNSNVGTIVNPLRLAIGAGFTFPTAHPPGG